MPKAKKIKSTFDPLELVSFPNPRPDIHAKTISSLELAKASYLLSDKLPKSIAVKRWRRMEYVGIGWIDCGELRGDEVVVTV